MTGSAIPWQQAHLVALDLEGTGAQDRDDEAILEIAVVLIIDGHPDLASAYCTLVNQQRTVPRRPWISPGLTTAALVGAPSIADIEPELARRLDGAFIVGHNVGVDWRLLHRRCPSIRPAGLINTLRLARLAYPGEKGNNLAWLLNRHQLTETVTQLAMDSQPHRALWDTTGAALLLHSLATAQYPNGTLSDLLGAASIDTGNDASETIQDPRRTIQLERPAADAYQSYASGFGTTTHRAWELPGRTNPAVGRMSELASRERLRGL